MSKAYTPTPRQEQILELLDAGKTNEEIAEALELSRHTVKVHIWRMFQAMGVDNRGKAVAWWRARRPDELSELRAERDELLELLRQCQRADLTTRTLTTGQSLADAVSAALDKRSGT